MDDLQRLIALGGASSSRHWRAPRCAEAGPPPDDHHGVLAIAEPPVPERPPPPETLVHPTELDVLIALRWEVHVPTANMKKEDGN